MPHASTHPLKLGLLAAFALVACEDKPGPNAAPSASAAPEPLRTSAAPTSAPTASSATR